MKVLTPEDLAHVESLTHHQRWEICQRLPDDYYPYGQNMARICRNPASHRYQYLTFEHQGCLKFDPGPIWQDEAAASP